LIRERMLIERFGPPRECRISVNERSSVVVWS
jgi:hypothetical protein